jgi:hypothetical protein
MTPSGFLTDDAWLEIVPKLTKGARLVLEKKAAELGIDAETCAKLLIGLLFDGCKIHLKNLEELVHMADENILALNEGRDSSEINQAFDRFVARAGKRRAAITLDQIRRSHVTPVIDGWMLCLVGLQMLRDCAASRVWENSFVAVNLHPHHRVSLDEWLQKINHFVQGAEKFEAEEIDEFALLPSDWKKKSLEKRNQWLKIIDDDGPVPSWDVDLIGKLREADMTLGLVAQMFKIHKVEKRLRAPNVSTNDAQLQTPPTKPKAISKNSMVYHLFNAKVPGMTDMDRYHHAITVRNRTLGPGVATTPSPYLDLEISSDNKMMLNLSPDDVNMHKVLQLSTCKRGRRRRVAKRCLNALGGVSGLCGFLNNEKELEEIKMNLKFAASFESVKHAEKKSKEDKAKQRRQKFYALAREKCGLQPGDKFYKQHVKKLTCAQMKAVCFTDCGGLIINGKVGELREKLTTLLDEDMGTPEYATQDEVHSPVPDDSDDSDDGSVSISMSVDIDSLTEGDCVEVYWAGDDAWFEGEVIGVDLNDRTFHVHYVSDGKKLWHDEENYKCRFAC